MITTTGIIYAVGLAGITFYSRVLLNYKRQKRARTEAELPLFDLVALEIATTPQRGSNDDGDVLTEMRETFQHLNRRRFAPEVWELDAQLAVYYNQVPEASRPTIRRALVRLIESEDSWMRIVGAKTAAALGVVEALPAIDAQIATHQESTDEAEKRFTDEMEAAAEKLRGVN
ncbi:MAG TPA: hypothetical protein VGK19_02160 [Capsulimonadaceae bacterium]|jgi:hypothetical protein